MIARRCHNEKPKLRLLWATWAVSLCAALAFQPTQAESYTAEAMWRLKRLSSPGISPDGRVAVVPVTRFDVQRNEGITDLWLVPTKPGKARQLTTAATDDHSPVWSPDGEWIAFVAQRGADRQPQIYVIAVSGGEARRVTNVPTGVIAPKWFPDSRRLAFLSRVWPDLKSWSAMEQRMSAQARSAISARIWDKPPIAHWDRFLDERQVHIYSVGIEGGEPQAITLESGRALDAASAHAGAYDISPDGSEVAFVSDSDPTGIAPNLDIYLLGSDGDAARNVTTDNAANDTMPIYSPDGRSLAFRRQTIKGFDADRAHLMLLDRRDQKLRNLSENWDRSADGLVWSPDSSALFGSIDDAGTQRIYRFDLAGGEPKAITRESSYHSLAVAGSGPVIVGLRHSFNEPPTLVSIIARTGTATKLSNFNDTTLANLTQGQSESVTYPGANGEPVQMWIVYPPDFTADKKWPLYLLLHDETHGVTDSHRWRWNAQVFANWGYVTAWHNFHGSGGFGQAWADSITGEPAVLPYQDTILAAEWLSTQPWIDADRMAAGGGGLAAVVLGKEHPFKTLVAHAARYDMYAQYGGDHGAQPWRHGEFWEDSERFARNSPHLSAADFKTPTLVIHGQLDQRVPVNQGMELFNTLQKRGVPSRFVYFPDEGHWILKPQNSLFWYRTKREWLEQYVKPGPVAPTPPDAAAPPSAKPPDTAAPPAGAPGVPIDATDNAAGSGRQQ